MSNTSSYRIKEPLWLALMVVIGILISAKFFPENKNTLFLKTSESEELGQIGRVEELVRFIDNRYVEEVDDDALLEKAISSIFSDLDPHSAYIPADQLGDVSEEMQGSYHGIGITTTFRDDSLYIQNIMADSPAEEAGFKVGDRILTINKEQISGGEKDYEEIKPKLRFKDDSEQEFLVDRGAQNVRILLNARELDNPSVDAAYLIDKDLLYVKLSRFSDEVYREFMHSIESFAENQNKLDLILDLRDNRGGYLPETVKILNQIFAERDRLLVYTEDRTKKRIEYKSKGNRFYNIDKVAILINNASASASEIIAGAIQDWDRGIILGQASFGKGLVQEQHPLSNGGAIRLTVARYYTPTGRSIQKPFKTSVVEQNSDTTAFYTMELRRKVQGTGGIVPDFEIEDDIDNLDTECQYALYELDYLVAKHRWKLEDSISLSDKLGQLILDLEFEADQSCKDALSKHLHYTLLRNESGVLKMIKSKNDQDPLVIKAVEQIKRADYFSL